MNTSEQIEQVEVSIEHAKQAIELRDALDRLGKNEDFKKIMTEGYFKDEASRLVLLKADPEAQTEDTQRYLDNSITAIGYVRLYFSTIMQLGIQMERSLKADEETLQELIEEDI